MTRRRNERGAAAVEFALILIPLLMILLGTIEFGFIFNQQLTVTNAAREGARVLAITRDEGDAVDAAAAAASALDGTLSVSVVETCLVNAVDGDAKVSVSYPITTITGLDTWVPGIDEITLHGTGVTPCGG